MLTKEEEIKRADEIVEMFRPLARNFHISQYPIGQFNVDVDACKLNATKIAILHVEKIVELLKQIDKSIKGQLDFAKIPHVDMDWILLTEHQQILQNLKERLKQ